MPPDKSKSPPGGGKPSDGLRPNNIALAEQAKHSTLSARGQMALTYAREYGPVAPMLQKSRATHTSEKNNGSRYGASRDPAVVENYWRRWPNARIGLALGDGIVVVDIDYKNGKDGFTSKAELEIQLGPLPVTGAVRTKTRVGQRRGQHLFYKVPQGTFVPPRPDLARGIDVLGDGSLVPMPDHFGWTGEENIYEWEHRPRRLAALPPAWVAALADNRRSPRSRRFPSGSRKPPAASPPVIDAGLADMMAADGGKGYERDDVPLRITCALAVIPADCGRETWWRVGAGIYSAMGEEGFLIFDDWSSSAAGNTPDGEPVYTPEGTRRMWRECARMSAITVATVYGIADEHDRSWREFYDNEMRARRAGR